jgi:hypothetical protein
MTTEKHFEVYREYVRRQMQIDDLIASLQIIVCTVLGFLLGLIAGVAIVT